MAARTARTNIQEHIKDKIQASQLIVRLNKHLEARGKKNSKDRLSLVDLRAIDMMLARSVPTLTATELTTLNPDDKLDENQILTRIAELIDNHPDLLQRALAAKARRNQADSGVSSGVSDADAQHKAASNQ